MFRILGYTANGLVDLGIGEILQLAYARGQRGEASRTEVHKGVQALNGLRHNIVPQGRVVPPPGAASIHRGRNTRGQTGHIRVYGTWPAAIKKVTVDVNQTRCHQVPAHVDDTLRCGAGQVRSERRYTAIAKGHVAALLQTLRRINNGTALEQEIILFSHGCLLCLTPRVPHAANEAG